MSRIHHMKILHLMFQKPVLGLLFLLVKLKYYNKFFVGQRGGWGEIKRIKHSFELNTFHFDVTLNEHEQDYVYNQIVGIRK